MRANKHLLLWSSLATLALLAWAAFAENVFQEWRVLQRRYRDRLPAEQRAEFVVQLRQVVVPGIRTADRCVTCHLGMAPGITPLEGDPIFGAHPEVVHDPGSYGCTVCHGGQGRATGSADAHGDVPHWPEPMIPARFAHAGCGSCHTHLAVPDRSRLAHGRALLERYDCLACHRVDGRGGTLRPGGAGGMEGPDLSRVGAVGFAPGWYESHLARRETDRGPWLASFGPIDGVERSDIDVYLSSRVGAPGLVEAKALFHSLGCRGCHAVGGVGGDDGPDLTGVGQRDPGQLGFDGVHGEHTLTSWLTEHFRAPARVVPGSAMPYLGLDDRQIEGLVLYMHALRRSELPEALWPADRIRAERFGEREFAEDGSTLYGTFCAACHGPTGQGMRYPGMAAFPAIASPDFLALASDAFLRATITHGRPGRRMPAWGEKEGGLRPAEIETVIGHLRELGGGIAAVEDGRPARWVAGDPGEGARLYAENCASCHGDDGRGKEGPALANRVLLQNATDSYLVETIRKGRRGTSMPGFLAGSPTQRALSRGEIESIVAFIRRFEEAS